LWNYSKTSLNPKKNQGLIFSQRTWPLKSVEIPTAYHLFITLEKDFAKLVDLADPEQSEKELETFANDGLFQEEIRSDPLLQGFLPHNGTLREKKENREFLLDDTLRQDSKLDLLRTLQIM